MNMTYPPVVSREKWLIVRKGLLAKETEFTMARNQLNAGRFADHFCVKHISRALVDPPAVIELVNEMTSPIAPAATCRIRLEHIALQLEQGTGAGQSPARPLLQGTPFRPPKVRFERQSLERLHGVSLSFGLFGREPGVMTNNGEL
jgi:hypothetical protein